MRGSLGDPHFCNARFVRYFLPYGFRLLEVSVIRPWC